MLRIEVAYSEATFPGNYYTVDLLSGCITVVADVRCLMFVVLQDVLQLARGITKGENDKGDDGVAWRRVSAYLISLLAV